MQEHGLAQAGWTFRFNHARQTLGVCRFSERRIELSKHFVIANPEAQVRDTVLHEIAHALAGPRAGHGSKWKAVCQRIGALPERVDRQACMPKGKYRAVCPACGWEYHRHRKPAHGGNYYCRACGPVEGALQFALLGAHSGTLEAKSLADQV